MSNLKELFTNGIGRIRFAEKHGSLQLHGTVPDRKQGVICFGQRHPCHNSAAGIPCDFQPDAETGR